MEQTIQEYILPLLTNQSLKTINVQSAKIMPAKRRAFGQACDQKNFLSALDN
jgi:hypothetical protein